MTSRTHDMIAFAGLITAAIYLPPNNLNLATTFACLIGNVVGALAPDLDQATNRLWDMLPAGNIVGKVLRNLLLSHRTISHSLLGGFLFYKLLEFVIPKLLNPNYVNSSLVILSIMIGFVLHLAADAITKDGIPILFPLPFKFGFPPIKAFRITTGKLMEKLVIFPLTIIYIIWLVTTNKETILRMINLIRS